MSAVREEKASVRGSVRRSGQELILALYLGDESPEFRDALKRMQDALEKMDRSAMERTLPQLREQNKTLLQEELLRIWDETKTTVLFITHSVDEAVTLGDTIMVMTAHPGRAKAIVDVPFARPRNVLELRETPAYGELVYDIWGQLRDEVLAAKAAEAGRR